MTTIPRETHRSMILSPYLWPHIYLPLKRPGKDGVGYECALLRSAMTEKHYNRHVEAGEPVEFHVDKNLTIFGLAIGEVERLTYDSPDAILDDGWVVD